MPLVSAPRVLPSEVAVGDEKPSAPTGLAARGLRFWRNVAGPFELEIDELELLTEICRQLDLVELLESTLAADGPLVEGSRGQTRLHPVVQALNAGRQLLARQLAQLALPNSDDESIASPASAQARRAAQARWRNHTPRGRRGAA